MPYVEIPSHRIAYNVDGTKVGYNNGSIDFGTGVTNWCTQTEMDNLNKENQLIYATSGSTVYKSYYFFFTEPKDMKGFFIRFLTNANGDSNPYRNVVIEGSSDSPDGIGGTWEVATYLDGNPFVNNDAASSWRQNYKRIKFTKPIMAMRVRIVLQGYAGASSSAYGALAIYGNPAPTGGDYLTVLNTDNTVKDKLVDFGDLEEGKNATQSFKLRNDSTTKTANTIVLSLSGQDAAEFTVSLDNTSFAATKTITSLAPGASATVYVKDTKPLGNVGPKQAILKSDVGSWV